MIPAYKTNTGATKQAYCMINGKSMRFVGFQVGDGGCRDGQVLTVNRNITSLPYLIHEFNSDNIEVSMSSPTSIKITCNVPSGSIGADFVSNIGIMAQIVGEEGTFLYAVSNFSQLPVTGNISFAITLNN